MARDLQEITRIRRADPEGVSTCRKCHVQQPDTEFYRSNFGRRGLSPYCKRCHNVDVKAYQKTVPQKKKVEIRRRSNLKRHYGISVDAYQQLWNKQNGVCAICGKAEDAQKGGRNVAVKMAVDHDHATGRVRALLCNRCNRAIGFFQDDHTLLQRATDYLRGHQSNGA